MRSYGQTSVSTFLDDSIVYRNLKPMDDRLPGLREIAIRLDIDTRQLPRKSEPDYARVMVELLVAARALDADKTAVQRLVYVGDTRLNDGTAFANLCSAGKWPGIAFIGSENQQPAQRQIIDQGETTTYLANRWALLNDFDDYAAHHGFPFDATTAVVLDLDKTTLGARGRNDRVINQARLTAVRETVEALLGPDFNAGQFEANYDLFNQTEFHPFTTDNQDYLAYLCLILGSDLFSVPALADTIREGQLAQFTDFLDQVEARSGALPERLCDLHDDIYSRVRAGDPTPFKAFRYNEYLATIRRMGSLPDDVCVDRMLAEEIVITQEVRDLASRWRDQGALLFALSDKPDEASVPTGELAKAGFKAIHRMPTHAVGAGADAAPCRE